MADDLNIRTGRLYAPPFPAPGTVAWRVTPYECKAAMRYTVPECGRMRVPVRAFREWGRAFDALLRITRGGNRLKGCST